MLNFFTSYSKKHFIFLILFVIIICVFFIPFISDNPLVLSNSQENSTLPNSIVLTSNSFYWPIPGYTRISSYFGYRSAPTARGYKFPWWN